MKIVYIHQHFTTNAGGGGTRSYDVGRHLVRMGHEVTVISGIGYRSGLPKLPRWQLWRTVRVDGIKVVLCNVSYSNYMSVLGRLWAFIGFALLATIACLREAGVDVIFATSTPLTVGIPGRLAATLKGIPYVFDVRDLWPEDLLAAGRLKPGLQYEIWQSLERFCYATASKILLVSKGFHDRLLERRFAPDRLRTLLLGADGELFKEHRPDREYMQEKGLAGKTVALYAGAHGDANGLDQVLDAAAFLKDRQDIAIVLIGDGKMRDGLRRRAAEEGLSNVHLLDPVPKTRLVRILQACDVGLMILKQIVRPRWVTPNKLFDYMFAGLPTIVNFPGTTADLVEAEGVGCVARPGDAEDLAAKIRHYADHPQQTRAVGRHARELAFCKYDREQIARALADELEAAVRNRRLRLASLIA